MGAIGRYARNFQTVYGSLYLALKIQPGETILIRGGTSSIGMLATQLAKNKGLTVIATTRNSEKKGMLIRNGANHVVIEDGYVTQKIKAINPQGVNKVLELVGTSTLKDSLSCVASGGTVCMTGMLAEQWSIVDFAPMEYIPAAVSLTIYDSGQIRVSDKYFQEFINDVESGTVTLQIGHVFSLPEIAEAHRLMEKNTAGGKIVVVT